MSSVTSSIYYVQVTWFWFVFFFFYWNVKLFISERLALPNMQSFSVFLIDVICMLGHNCHAIHV